jgi:Purple acid Phosphatase, N-terminal domain/Calcineurin-like phosphoesterase
MAPDMGNNGELESAGGVGPPGSVSRRRLLQGAAAAGLTLSASQLETSSAVAARAVGAGPARGAARRRSATATRSAPPVAGLHLQFGADASNEVVVSWQTYASVESPRVYLGTLERGLRSWPVAATTTGYVDSKEPDEPVFVHSARLSGLRPDREYFYVAVHEGADPEGGGFRTAPRGRAAFTFTSFGDQGTPTLTAPTNLPSPAPKYANDNLGSPAAGDVTEGVEKIAPLFHLVNGDLCYANLSTVPVRTWSDWFAFNSRSARYRPWMPTAGNHENEALGAHGFEAYQTYFTVPSNGQGPDSQGLWYSFRAGSVKVIAVNNDDVCLQDAGSEYVHGYSGGAQKQWLEGELAAARSDRSIDWIVICMHQVAMSTAKGFNGADIGIRQEWLPLFDKYVVDLVVCGHEHHYERTQPVRGTTGSPTLTPQPVPMSAQTIDTTNGTLHMIIGGGGTSVPSNQILTNPPVCQVITSVGPGKSAPGPGAPTGHFVSNYTQENAIWSSVRDQEHSYGFAAFTVDPGHRPGGTTSIEVTYYRVNGFGADLEVFDSFTLTRRRSDG